MLSKEDPIFSSLSHKLGRSVDEVGHRIHQALLRVSLPVQLGLMTKIHCKIQQNYVRKN